MGEWKAGDGVMEGWEDRRTERWEDKRIGWRDGKMGGWKNGRTERCLLHWTGKYFFKHCAESLAGVTSQGSTARG